MDKVLLREDQTEKVDTDESQSPQINQEMANLLISDLNTQKPSTAQVPIKKLDPETVPSESQVSDNSGKANEKTTKSSPIIVNSKTEQ